MAVHKTGTLQPVAGDLQITHLGVPIAVKMIQWGGDSMAVLALIEKKATAWEAIQVIYEFDDPTLAILTKEAGVAGGLLAWVKRDLIPLINAALLKRFPPTNVPPPVPTDIVGLADKAMIDALRLVPQADGTIRVEAK